MRAHAREWIPFRCPACGYSTPIALRIRRGTMTPPPTLSARLWRGLRPVYVCPQCASRAAPERLWLVTTLAALVFATAALVVVTTPTGLSLVATLIVTGLASLGCALIVFQVGARYVLDWRSVDVTRPPDPGA